MRSKRARRTLVLLFHRRTISQPDYNTFLTLPELSRREQAPGEVA